MKQYENEYNIVKLDKVLFFFFLLWNGTLNVHSLFIATKYFCIRGIIYSMKIYNDECN